METSKLPSEKALIDLQEEIELYKESMQEVSKNIMESELSDFPVFIAHQGTIAFGENILDHTDFGTQWSINATYLEDLKRVGLIANSGEQQFKDAFKDPKTHFCVLLVTKRPAHFVFLPIS